MAKKYTQPAAVTIEQLQIQSGDAPVRKAKTWRSAAYEPVLQQAMALKPGEWFVWPEAPKGYRSTYRKFVTRGLKGCDAYRDTQGRVIVRRLPVDGMKPEAKQPDGKARAVKAETPLQLADGDLPVPFERQQVLVLAVLHRAAGRALTPSDIREAGAGNCVDAIAALQRAGYLNAVKVNGRGAVVLDPAAKTAAAMASEREKL